jgi:hypothetical protein
MICRVIWATLVLVASTAWAGVIEPGIHHLRHGEKREWGEFPERAEGAALVRTFQGKANTTEHAIRLRHRDLRHQWEVQVNGKRVARLPLDENEIVTCWAVPAGVLRDEDNELRVVCTANAAAPPDDVMVGEVEWIERPFAEVLSESVLDIEVTDGDSGDALPCRLTITDSRGALVPLGTTSNEKLAVRPGVVYTVDGRAAVRLAAGRYTVYAGRGFEYSIDSAEVQVKAGETARRRLKIKRVVLTAGWVSCDPHVHTLTYARNHGDATVRERMLTFAGEGIELAVSTEHNLQVDYGPEAEEMGVRRHFTPVIGNEVTTASLGHFNVLPIPANSKLIDWRGRDWNSVSKSIDEIAPEAVVILNHGRDLHGGFRPFDPKRHISLTGQSLDGREPPANAMEVINSGAIQTNPMLLYRDWFGLLNRGRRIAPVGASDSHDVTRYIVGQGRTYIRCDDADPGRIDVEAARKSLLEGRVTVSYGLLVKVTVDGQFGPGDLVTPRGDLEVQLRVLGPEWVRADAVSLYANGVLLREEKIGNRDAAGVKWSDKWTLPRPKHDAWLCAIARGPGVSKPYWPTAKPYQPTSIEWLPYVIGSTGAVFIDADGSGKFESAFDYATRMTEGSADLRSVVAKLEGFDESVAAQAAGIFAARDPTQFVENARAALGNAPPSAKRGIGTLLREWESVPRK